MQEVNIYARAAVAVNEKTGATLAGTAVSGGNRVLQKLTPVVR